MTPGLAAQVAAPPPPGAAVASGPCLQRPGSADGPCLQRPGSAGASGPCCQRPGWAGAGIAHVPRVSLGVLPTPLVRAARLGPALGLELWVKRDDLAGFVLAGTKTRALEYLMADALDRGADTVVGCGGPGSNFCPALAAAAAICGLACELVCFGGPAAGAHPNLTSARAWGAQVRFTGSPDRDAVEDAADARAAELRAAGGRPYVVPPGGSTAVGAIGAAAAVAELGGGPGGRPPTQIVVGAGSGGTAAGLLVGVAAEGWPTLVCAASVSRPVDETRSHVLGLARACATRLGTPLPEGSGLEVHDALAPGFGLAGADARDAAALALRSEGLLLDPTYTAKAVALLVRRAPDWATGERATGEVVGERATSERATSEVVSERATSERVTGEVVSERATRGGPVVYWHTGGALGALLSLAEGAPGGAVTF